MMKTPSSTTSTPLTAITLILALLGLPALHAETYGSGVTLEESTPIATILAAPEEWQGQRVRVEGEVTDVCPKKGCWMSVAEGDAAIRIKVEDDVIVFPASAKSRHAVAEGIVEIISLDRDGYAGWLQHLAEERGETFDPTTVGEGPYQIVQIKGEGAVL